MGHLFLFGLLWLTFIALGIAMRASVPTTVQPTANDFISILWISAVVSGVVTVFVSGFVAILFAAFGG